jgi:nitrite reductase/ring-hydroxylating ferredoxin subunit
MFELAECRYDDGAYPESWYAIMPSKKLKSGSVQPLDAFGKSLALFRTSSGTPALVERFCPHQGASLAVGRVQGERLICPFHAWEFDARGECQRIPYESKVPKAACLSSLPVVEHLGWLWAYNGAVPAFRLPEMREAAQPGFFAHGWSRELDVHPLMILENAGDLEHFRVIHRLDFKKIDVQILREEAHDFEFRLELEGGTGRRFFGGRQRLTFHYVGASVIFGTIELDQRMLARFFVSPLPIGPRRSIVHHVVFTKLLGGPLLPLNAIYVPLLLYHSYRGIADEYAPVWQNMTTRPARVLVGSDWLQQRFHRYYASHLEKGHVRQAPEQAILPSWSRGSSP